MNLCELGTYSLPVLGICDILVRIRIPRSVLLTNGSGSDSFLHWFFSHFFLVTCPQPHHLQFKKLNFLLKFCVQILFCRPYTLQNMIFFYFCGSFLPSWIRIQIPNTDPDPNLLARLNTDPIRIRIRNPGGSAPLTNGSVSGRPKTCGSGSSTLLFADLTFSFVLQDLRRPARFRTTSLFVWRGWPIQANSTSALENIEEYQYNILMSILRKTVC